jgi:hypothetical protein
MLKSLLPVKREISFVVIRYSGIENQEFPDCALRSFALQKKFNAIFSDIK